MRQLRTILFTGVLLLTTAATRAQKIDVGRFHKVIVSPYIQATFVAGNEESVTINGTNIDSRKLHVEVHGGTLRIYLEGAKDFPKNEPDDPKDGGQHTHALYPNHAVIVTITYRQLDALSLRGTENYLCESPLSGKAFTLHVYGESTAVFTEVHFRRLHAVIYGESSLDIRSGEVDEQYYACYGEGKINATAIAGYLAKVTAFGDAEFRVNVSNEIRIAAFGDAKLCYLGNPTIVKGIHLGDVDLRKID